MAYQQQAKSRASDFASDYANIRTIPAVPSVAYVMARLYHSAPPHYRKKSIPSCPLFCEERT